MTSPITGGPAELRSHQYFQTPEQVQRELDLLDAVYARLIDKGSLKKETI